MATEWSPNPWQGTQKEDELDSILRDVAKTTVKKSAEQLLDPKTDPAIKAQLKRNVHVGVKKLKSPPAGAASPVTPSPMEGPIPIPGGGTIGQGGVEAEAELNHQGQNKTTVNRLLQMTDPEYNAALNTVRGIRPDGSVDPGNPYQQQEAGLNRLDDLNRQYAAQPTQLDLSPLMALTDSLYGTKLGAGYTKPESSSARRDAIMKFADESQKRHSELYKNVTEAVKSNKAGSAMDLMLADWASKYKVSHEDPIMHKPKGTGTDQEIKWGNTFQDKLKGDEDIKKANDQLRGAHMAKQMLMSGKSVADEGFKIAFTRAMGDNHISNVDIAKKNGSTDAVDRLEQTFNTITTGKFTEENRASYLQVLNDLERISLWKKEARRQYWQKQGTTTYKFSPEKAKAMVRDGLEMENAGPGFTSSDDPDVQSAIKKAGGKTTDSKPKMSFEEWKKANGR